jgi:hypothetical protein
MCKNNPIWGLVLIEVGPDGHLICLSCCFSCHSDKIINYGALGSFLCRVMCCAQSPSPSPPSLLPDCPWYCHCLQCRRSTRGMRWGVNAAGLAQRGGGGMEGMGGGASASLPRCILGLVLDTLTTLIRESSQVDEDMPPPPPRHLSGAAGAEGGRCAATATRTIAAIAAAGPCPTRDHCHCRRPPPPRPGSSPTPPKPTLSS